jgi:hypothetical protein
VTEATASVEALEAVEDCFFEFNFSSMEDMRSVGLGFMDLKARYS